MINSIIIDQYIQLKIHGKCRFACVFTNYVHIMQINYTYYAYEE
jgi:hypothetical protein